jgi:hypothetical protein
MAASTVPSGWMKNIRPRKRVCPSTAFVSPSAPEGSSFHRKLYPPAVRKNGGELFPNSAAGQWAKWWQGGNNRNYGFYPELIN